MIIQKNPVLRETAHALIPLILLYAFYVQFHGHFGPGGGFQAGVIFSVGLIIYKLIYGFDHTHSIVTPRIAEILACAGVLLYCGVGFITMLLGGSFLDYNLLAFQPLLGQHIGIFLVELGVGITIVGTIVGVFLLVTETQS